MKCDRCGAEIPEVSRFCLSCGKEVPPPTQATVEPKEDDEVNFGAIVLFMIAFMVFFLTLVPVFLGLWIGVAVMAGIGTLLVIGGLLLIRSKKKEIQRAKEEANVRLKCHYCGSLNRKDATRCDSCGATL